MLQAILFDLGDTLLDFEPMHMRSVFRGAAMETYSFLRERGCRLPRFEKYWRRHLWSVQWAYCLSRIRRREFNCMDLLRRFARQSGLQHDELSLMNLAWLWYLPIVNRASIDPDLVPTLRRLRDAGLKLGLVSNTFIPGSVLDRHLKVAGIFDFFPVRVYSSEVGYRKPHPRIFEIALDEIGSSPRHTMFVGDMVKTDIVGARRMGMTTVLRQARGTIRKHDLADHVVRRVADICPLVFADPARLPAALKSAVAPAVGVRPAV